MRIQTAPTGSAGSDINTWTTALSVDNSCYVNMPLQPAFWVYGSPSKDGNDIVHSFGTTDFNIGSHYNNANGRFTAPVTGRYIFTAALWAANGEDHYMDIHRNAVTGAGAHVNSADGTHSGTLSVVLHLAASDYVSIFCGFDIQGSTPRNFFSGHLLS